MVLLDLLFSLQINAMIITIRHTRLAVAVMRRMANTRLMTTQFCDNIDEDVGDGEESMSVVVKTVEAVKRQIY